VLILDMIEVIPPLRKYKYDTWRILPVKCYIDNSVRLWSCIRNINNRSGLLADKNPMSYVHRCIMILWDETPSTPLFIG
jgi:hypothetical protein